MTDDTFFIRISVTTDRSLVEFLEMTATALRRGILSPLDVADSLDAAAGAIRNSVARREELLP